MELPQGSVQGPVLFTVDPAPVAAIVRQHSLSVQLYANNTQPYLTFDIADAPDSCHALRLVCSASGSGWLITSSNLMTKRRLYCSWEHLLWDHSLISVVSPSATLSSAAHPVHATLVLSSTSTLAWRPTPETSAALLSTIFTTSAGSAMSLISRQLRQLSGPSSPPAWTIVTHFYTGCHLHSSTGCSRCRTRQPSGGLGGWTGAHHTGAFQAPLASCAVPHHLQDPASNVLCAAWSCPCVPYCIAGLLRTISGTKIRPAAASTRPPD